VVAELSQNIAGWEQVQGALEEIRACQSETTKFITGLFEEFNSLWESLSLEKQRIEKQDAGSRNNRPAGSENDDTFWEGICRELEEGREGLHHTEQVVQEQVVNLTATADDLVKIKNEIRSVLGEIVQQSGELAAARSQSLSASQDTESGIKDKIHEMEQQQSLLEKERAVMQTELESIRRRAAEMTDSLTEQKRATAQEQNLRMEDMRQMRTMLETLTRQLADSMRQNDSQSDINSGSAMCDAAKGDPVLESVVSQFEMLQLDRDRRRQDNMQ
jgi:chromosome segregation ATPase